MMSVEEIPEDFAETGKQYAYAVFIAVVIFISIAAVFRKSGNIYSCKSPRLT